MIDRTALPVRRPNRLPQYDYSRDGAYFITICSRDREAIFWNTSYSDAAYRGGSHPPAETNRMPETYLSAIGRFVDTAIRRIPDCYASVYLDGYCILPDHVHLLIRIQSSDADGRVRSAPTISTIVGQTKRLAAKWAGKPIWQKGFHDHVIRGEDDYLQTIQYIENNIVRQTEGIPKGV